MNYGAVLQAYALKSYLESLGHEVEILNYNTSYLYLQNRPFQAKIKSFAWNIVKICLGGKKKIVSFDNFRKQKLELSKFELKSHAEITNYAASQDFDAFIVGSDQVWNPKINGGDTAYYLDFANDQLRISYAASFGVSVIEDIERKLILDNLLKFNAISIREYTGLNILAPLSENTNLDVVLDPVFLPDLSVWNQIAGDRIMNNKYILCYVMVGDKALESRTVQIAKQYRIQTGSQIVFVGRKEYYRFKNDGTDLVSASPEEFVNLIKYAEFVVTNSFHGTAFSTIFSKQFYSLINTEISKEKQLSSRICDLLEKVGLMDRVLDLKNDYDFANVIEYKAVQKQLDILKEKSKQFLLKSLEKRR